MPCLDTFGAASFRGFNPGGNGSGLYAFTSHIFTNGGYDSYLGASLAQFKTAYSAASWAQNAAFFTSANGIQFWTVPKTGSYRFRVAGAGGGTAYTGEAGGQGVIIEGTAALVQGDIIRIIVGTRGGRYSHTAGGGGASSFVKVPTNTTYYTTSLPYIIAGAGGGGGNSGGAGKNAIFTATQPEFGYSGQSSGSGGYGGNPTPGTSAGGWGVAGAGWLSGGGGNANENHANWSGSNPSRAQNGSTSNLVNGASASHGTGYSSSYHDYAASGSCYGAPGGFGGGGSGQCNGAGGGAGYNGGAAGGAGGASYFNSTYMTNQNNYGYNPANTNGYITVTLL